MVERIDTRKVRRHCHLRSSLRVEVAGRMEGKQLLLSHVLMCRKKLAVRLHIEPITVLCGSTRKEERQHAH